MANEDMLTENILSKLTDDELLEIVIDVVAMMTRIVPYDTAVDVRFPKLRRKFPKIVAEVWIDQHICSHALWESEPRETIHGCLVDLAKRVLENYGYTADHAKEAVEAIKQKIADKKASAPTP